MPLIDSGGRRGLLTCENKYLRLFLVRLFLMEVGGIIKYASAKGAYRNRCVAGNVGVAVTG